MKEYEVIISDWADRNNVIVEHYEETSFEINIYACNIHYQDIVKLNNLVEEWHVTFIDPVSDELIKIKINLD